MDAATLYIVMAVGTGPKRMSTSKYPTMEICRRAADKMHKRSSMKDATVYCVKRDPDREDKRLAAQAGQAAAARKRRMQAGQAQAPQQTTAGAPPGMPREFFTGTTAKQ